MIQRDGVCRRKLFGFLSFLLPFKIQLSCVMFTLKSSLQGKKFHILYCYILKLHLKKISVNILFGDSFKHEKFQEHK